MAENEETTCTFSHSDTGGKTHCVTVNDKQMERAVKLAENLAGVTTLHVDFGKVNRDDEWVDIGITVPRGDTTPTPTDMDAMLANSLLDVTLSRSPSEHADLGGQQTMGDDQQCKHEHAATCAGFNDRHKQYTFSLRFALEAVTADELGKFCGKTGTLELRRVGDAK